MKQNIYEIFHLSFPQLAISKEQFEREIHLSSCQCLTAEEDGKLVGFSLIQGNMTGSSLTASLSPCP